MIWAVPSWGKKCQTCESDLEVIVLFIKAKQPNLIKEKTPQGSWKADEGEEDEKSAESHE